VVGLRVGSGMLAVAAVAHVLVHMLVDTVAAVVLGLGLVPVPVLVVVEDTGAGILVVGRMVVACLVWPCRARPYLAPCRPPYPRPSPQAKTSGPCCLLYELWETELFECEGYCVKRCDRSC